MYQYILKRLAIKEEEAGFTIFLLVSAILLGGVLGSFDIIAHTNYFEYWGKKDSLMFREHFPLAYILGGTFGVILFGIYTVLHKRISYKSFHFVNISLITAIVLAYLVFYYLFPEEFLDNKKLAFIGLVLVFPVNLLLLLTFWRYVRKLLLPEQAKRIFNVVEFGFIGGIIASCGLIFLVSFYMGFDATSVLTALFMLGLFLIQVLTNIAHNRNKAFNHKKERKVPVRASIFLLWSTRFTRNLLLFTILSAIVGFHLHYTFVTEFQDYYFEIDTFSKYYVLYIAVLYALIYFTDKILVHSILYSYDSPYSLVIMPLGVFFFLLLTLGGIVILQKAGIKHPLPVLLLIGINKMVYEVSKNTIQLPSSRTLYRSLDIRFLQIIYPRIEGAAAMLGLLISGGVIFLIQQFNLDNKIVNLTTSIVLSLIWFFFAVKLIKRYRRALEDSYRKLRINRTIRKYTESYSEKLWEILVGDDPVKVINAMKLSALIEPLSYEKGLQRMLANPQPEVQAYVLKCIEEEVLLGLLPDLQKLSPASEEAVPALGKLIQNFEKREKLLHEGVDIEELMNSRQVAKRVLAAEIIGSRKDVTYTSVLVNLTREFEPDVKIAAVKAMARISSSDHSYLLMEFLSSPEYHAYAFEALVQIGDPALDYLERLFINPNTDDKILSRAIRIYGKVATPKAVDYLLSKLENQSKRVTSTTISALQEANFQANSMNVHRILNIVVRTIHVLGWNHLIYISLPSKAAYRELKASLVDEINTSYGLLFDLLALAYNSRTILEIQELLEKGSEEDISHAIELLDQFVMEDIKPVLFPIIENISAKERVQRLQYYFPIEKMDKEELISSILMRDYNLLGVYPRICALRLALILPGLELTQELISNLFHPNRMLREAAALVVHKRDPELFESIMERLDPDVQFELRDALSIVERGSRLLLTEKFNLLKEMERLKYIPEDILINLAELFYEVGFKAGTSLDIGHNCNDFTLFFMVEGSMHFEGPEGEIQPGKLRNLYYVNIFPNAGMNTIHFNENTTILAVKKESIEELLFDHTEIASCVLSCVQQFKKAS
ncbi:MAG: hypothetical protein JW801_12465 [Bacteroidales bacterium]|nr:hypothetical protein [Bacteroidales bacterium]